MIENPGQFGRLRNAVLLLSAITWIVLVVEPGGLGMPHCVSMSSAASFQMLLAMNPPGSLAVGWALMLVAMMAPVLIPPVRYIHLRSFTHRRARSTAFFLAGYAAVWMAIGCVLLAVELTATSPAPACLLLIALVWQCSPVKQRCLNRCHAHTELAAFGAAADLGALRFGLIHGIWCAGSCWALMLFPMLLPRGHVVAMAAVAVVIFSERLDHPEPPSWRWRGCGTAIRIAVAQMQKPGTVHSITNY